MKTTSFSYTFLETMIDKSLTDIAINHTPAIRKLANTLLLLPSTTIPQNVMYFVKENLKYDNNPYYTLINNMVNYCDHKILKRNLLNLGYHQYQNGINIIKEKEKLFNCHIPCSVIFSFEKDSSNLLSIKEINNILNHCESDGIHSCIFIIDNQSISLDQLVSILTTHKESTFFLLIRPNLLNQKVTEDIKLAENIIVGININSLIEFSNSMDAFKLLFRYKILYGVYTYCSDQNINDLITIEFNQFMVKSKSAFFVGIPKDMSRNSYNYYTNYINQRKFSLVPFFIVDFYSDFYYVNSAINNAKVLVGIKEDGKIVKDKLDNIQNDLDIHKQSLESIFKKANPI